MPKSILSSFLRFTSLILILLIRIYQLCFSALFGHCCRFHPNCSSYGISAVQYHGPIRGSWIALLRIFRCHPWHPGGVDLLKLPLDKTTYV